MNILECSSKGDKRFSAFYAYVKVYGKLTSIENHYQGAKKFYDETIINPKGKKPDYMQIGAKKLDIKYLTAWYKLLWVKYLDQNQELVEYAAQFDDYKDMFKTKHVKNCQADVIRQYVKQGRSSILKEQDVIELLNILKNKQ